MHPGSRSGGVGGRSASSTVASNRTPSADGTNKFVAPQTRAPSKKKSKGSSYRTALAPPEQPLPHPVNAVAVSVRVALQCYI